MQKYFGLLITLLTISSANAQLCIQQTEIISTLYLPFNRVAVDVDQDGDLDIVSTANYLPGTTLPGIAWYENNGEIIPQFVEHVVENSFETLRRLKVVDFDGDGYPDIFAEAEFTGVHFWYHNTGGNNPSFVQRQTGWVGSSPAAFADIDGDGGTDILQDSTRWFRYTGSGSTHFEEMSFTTLINGPITGTADINQDGRQDLITSSGNWYQNTPGMIPVFIEREISQSTPGIVLEPVDLTNNGYPDLLGTNDKWFLNNGPMSNPDLQFSINSTGGLGPEALTPADIDGDGLIDLVGNESFWFKNVYPNSPSFELQLINDSGRWGPFLARDLDGDDDIDLMNPDDTIWHRNEIDAMGNVSFSVQEFIGLDPLPMFNTAETLLQDFDNDGDLDLLRSRTGLLEWFNNSTIQNATTDARYGDLQTAINESSDGDTLIGDSGIFDCSTELAMYGRAINVVSRSDLYAPQALMFNTGSIQAAPNSDAVFSNLTVGSASMGGFETPFISARTVIANNYFGSGLNVNGNLKMVPGVLLNNRYNSVVGGIQQIKTGDMDNDGDDDAIILKSNNRLSWFEHTPSVNTSWSGIEKALFPVTEISESFEMGDINNDGLIDIIAYDAGELFLMLNNGADNDLLPFTLQTIIAGDFIFGDIAVGDFDNDGDLDIVHGGLGIAKGGQPTRLFTNDGNNPPNFTTTTIFNHLYSVRHINIVDLDNDGDLEVLIAQESRQIDSGIVVLENQGTNPATFISDEIAYIAGAIPDRVYGGDFDNDGDGDILVLYPSPIDPKIILLESNAPSLGYRGRVIADRFAGESFGNDLALGDFDRDGDLDFVTGQTVLYSNTGSSPVFFRKDEQFSNGEPGVIHQSNYSVYDSPESIDLIRSNPSLGTIEWVENEYNASLNLDFESVLNISGDLELISTRAFDPPFGGIDVGGEIRVDRNSELHAYSTSVLNTTKLINSGELRLFEYGPPPVKVWTQIPGDYQQYEIYPEGEVSGLMYIEMITGGAIGGLEVLGTAALSGSLQIPDYLLGIEVPADELIGPIIRASSFALGRDQFDVVSVPIVDILLADGTTTQGTVLPVYSKGIGAFQEIWLQPITLDELLFTQSSFISEGIPNDAVLADVTGAPDGSPDGDIDLIVAIPTIPGVAPDGAVAVFQGSLNVNGFQMISASLYTGAIVDSPGSVEVGYFDNDSIPDIAFANQGTNANNNDVHFLHMNSSSPIPISIAPLPSFSIGNGLTVTDLATDDFVSGGEGTDDLLLGVQSNGNGGGVVQTIAFGSMTWESCEVDVDDVDTVTPGRSDVAARGLALANVIITSPDSDTATYFVNLGDFENMVPIIIPTGTHPTEVVAEDLNGDGEPEVVVICEGNPGSQGVITVSRNLGGNSFAAPVDLPLGVNFMVNPMPVSLALSDVDDDGDRDIVIVSINDAGDQRVRIIRNSTVPGNSLSFASVTDAPNQPSGLPLIVRSADLDGDSPTVADDIVVLVDPSSNLARNVGGSALNSIDLSGDFCAPDLNRDGVLDFFDISAFLSSFSAGDSAADFTVDGVFDFFDISAFLNALTAGCE